MRTKTLKLLGSTLVVGVLAVAPARAEERSAYRDDAATWRHAALMIEEGRETFRLDNFGNEDFWGGAAPAARVDRRRGERRRRTAA